MAETKKRRLRSRGFTIVEAMIVLAAIGLLLGGILKGQELINNAKVRALTDRTTTMQIAWRNFVMRYGWEPGDFPRASENIDGSLGNGDGENGLEEVESALAMSHLHAASLLRCQVCTSTMRLTGAPAQTDHPGNGFGGVFSFVVPGIADNPTGTIRDYARTEFDSATRLGLSIGTGASNRILAEIDQKIDDGLPITGLFRLAVEDTIDTPCVSIYNDMGVFVRTSIRVSTLSVLTGANTGYDLLVRNGRELLWSPPAGPGVRAVTDTSCAAAYLL